MNHYIKSGRTAYCAGYKYDDNPYLPGTVSWEAWSNEYLSEFKSRLEAAPAPNGEDPSAEYQSWLSEQGLAEDKKKGKYNYETQISSND